jgi:hypothetical protein
LPQDNLNMSSEVARTSNQQQNLSVAFAFLKQRRRTEVNGGEPLVPRGQASTSHFIATRAEDVQQFAARLASYLAGSVARVANEAMVRVSCVCARIVDVGRAGHRHQAFARVHAKRVAVHGAALAAAAEG